MSKIDLSKYGITGVTEIYTILLTSSCSRRRPNRDFRVSKKVS